jgi:hypothetical protein
MNKTSSFSVKAITRTRRYKYDYNCHKTYDLLYYLGLEALIVLILDLFGAFNSKDNSQIFF